MTVKEIYEKLENVGTLTASTIHEGEVHSRIIHLNGYDKHGIYFRTMWNKPFARQLLYTKKITLCGVTDSRILSHDINGVPDFPPGYSIRVIGEVSHIPEQEIREIAKTNDFLKLAVVDMEKYPAMADGNFYIDKAKGEIFDFDFDKIHRDHKILRLRFSYGGMEVHEPGPVITSACIACGKCYKHCTFNAIKKGSPYSIISERCDDCGNCIMHCPVKAIQVSQAL